MKKLIALTILVWMGAIANGVMAQESKTTPNLNRKALKEAEKAREKAEEKALEQLRYENALKALNENQFAIEANQAIFRNGESAYVTPNTNFVIVDGDKGTVQVAFNTTYPGPNGIGGVTVDGSVSNFKKKTDRRGNINCSFNIQGIGISAQVYFTLVKGSSEITININPNFNSNTLTLNGTIMPLNESNVFKGRSW